MFQPFASFDPNPLGCGLRAGFGCLVCVGLSVFAQVLCASSRLYESDAAVLKVITEILDLGKKKSYLQELCCEAMFTIIDQANVAGIKVELTTELAARFPEGQGVQPDSVALVLVMALQLHGVVVNLPFVKASPASAARWHGMLVGIGC